MKISHYQILPNILFFIAGCVRVLLGGVSRTRVHLCACQAAV